MLANPKLVSWHITEAHGFPFLKLKGKTVAIQGFGFQKKRHRERGAVKKK
jgi:hypothetical protein